VFQFKHLEQKQNCSKFYHIKTRRQWRNQMVAVVGAGISSGSGPTLGNEYGNKPFLL